ERRHPIRFLGTGVDSRPRPPPARVPGEMECGEPEEVQEVQGAAGPAREEKEEQREEREDDPGQTSIKIQVLGLDLFSLLTKESDLAAYLKMKSKNLSIYNYTQTQEKYTRKYEGLSLANKLDKVGPCCCY
ncbi:hypothetical protein ACJX0J_020130, partial [Zea mays]